MNTLSREPHGSFMPAPHGRGMTHRTRALALLTAVPATLALTLAGAATAAAQPAPTDQSAENPPRGVVHYDGLFDDLDDLHVPHHLRHQINVALGSTGIAIPWHLLDGLDDDRWDDNDDDDDDDWDDGWDD